MNKIPNNPGPPIQSQLATWGEYSLTGNEESGMIKWQKGFAFYPKEPEKGRRRDGNGGFGSEMEGPEDDPFRPVSRWWVDASGLARLWVDPMFEEALGFKHKRRSLQEIVQSTRKETAELIGYNEEPISISDVDSSSRESLQEPEKTPLKLLQDAEEIPCKRSQDLEATPSKLSQCLEATPSNLSPDSEKTHSHLNVRKNTGPPRTSKMQLYDICAANCWECPSFVLCKEEGPSHRKMFTFKVIVQLDGISSTHLECYSEPKQQKKAAQEHAAEGALWYLEHLGYLPNA